MEFNNGQGILKVLVIFIKYLNSVKNFIQSHVNKRYIVKPMFCFICIWKNTYDSLSSCFKIKWHADDASKNVNVKHEFNINKLMNREN